MAPKHILSNAEWPKLIRMSHLALTAWKVARYYREILPFQKDYLNMNEKILSSEESSMFLVQNGGRAWFLWKWRDHLNLRGKLNFEICDWQQKGKFKFQHLFTYIYCPESLKYLSGQFEMLRFLIHCPQNWITLNFVIQ